MAVVEDERQWAMSAAARARHEDNMEREIILLGKSQLLLLVQPRVFATTNHFREMLPSPTVRALDEALGPKKPRLSHPHG
jgi:hypothetical protein